MAAEGEKSAISSKERRGRASAYRARPQPFHRARPGTPACDLPMQLSSAPSGTASTPAATLDVFARAPAAVLLLLLPPLLLPRLSRAGKAAIEPGSVAVSVSKLGCGRDVAFVPFHGVEHHRSRLHFEEPSLSLKSNAMEPCVGNI